MGDVHDPVLGRLMRDPRFGWYTSDPRAVDFLRGQQCRFVLEDYDSGNGTEIAEIQCAVQNALNAGREILTPTRTRNWWASSTSHTPQHAIAEGGPSDNRPLRHQPKRSPAGT